MEKKSEVIVIGGGIIGLSVAAELAEKGVLVTVIEKNKIGHGCSYGNAGWMTPCFAMPLPMPGLFFKSLKWLMNPESPLYIKPSPSLLLAKWLTLFMRAMNEKQAKAAIEALVVLSQSSLKLYEELGTQYPEMKFEKKGLLMVGQGPEGVAAAVEEMNLVADYGVPGQKLNCEETKEMEPSLVGKVEGAVYFPEEAHAEPLKVVEALRAKAEKLGAKIIEGIEVHYFDLAGGSIRALQTSQGEMKADQYVLATGSWSEEWSKALNLSIPILGGKGYAIITQPLTPQPKVPMMLVEKKVAITPRADSLRIAGTLELVHQDFSITDRRVKAIIKGAREFLPVPERLEVQELWAGLRPCTPDGVPLIGRSKKWNNLYLACGHQMLGLQSGLGTGRLVAELITQGHSDLDRAVYNPDRFF
jgi:D-amino-acid dehydrogenase